MISIISITVLVLAGTVRMEIRDELKIIDIKTRVAVDMKKDCGPGTKPCIMKCCAENEVLYKKPSVKDLMCRNLKVLSKEYTSIAVQNLVDYSNIRTISGKRVSFFKDFRILYSDRYVNNTHYKGPDLGKIDEAGTAYWKPYRDDPSITILTVAPYFCMDIFIGLSPQDKKLKRAFDAFYYRRDDTASLIRKTKFTAYGGVVSAFFLLLVFVIHCLIKFLHGNPKGKLLMLFIFSLTLFYVCNAWYAFSTLWYLEKNLPTQNAPPSCKWVSPIGYFMFVSSFFWLNAMCYDIWRKFRSSKLKGFESDDTKKMRLYSAYALGVPLLCTAVTVLIDQYGSDLVRLRFENCMRDDNNYLWKRLYLRLPTGLVVLSNVVMWVLTVRNVRRVRIEFARTARKESTHTRKGEILSNVYGKLFILMGVNWMIEILLIPVRNMSEWVFYLTNAPNTLLGVWIFLVTVCKKQIFIELCRRFRIKNKWTKNMNTTQVSQVTSISRAKSSNKNKNTDMA